MSDEDNPPLESDLIEVLEVMRKKGDQAFDAMVIAFRHMSNIGFMMVEAHTSYVMNTEIDESLGPESRLEHDRQIAAQMTALRYLCEAAAMVPELRRRYEAHGLHKEIPFGFFLSFISDWANMRKAEVVTVEYMMTELEKAEAEGRPFAPALPKKPWTVRDAGRYQKLLGQWESLEAAVRWDREQPRSISEINITTATRLLKLYQERDQKRG